MPCSHNFVTIEKQFLLLEINYNCYWNSCMSICVGGKNRSISFVRARERNPHHILKTHSHVMYAAHIYGEIGSEYIRI